jgi:hypothetical protein
MLKQINTKIGRINCIPDSGVRAKFMRRGPTMIVSAYVWKQVRNTPLLTNYFVGADASHPGPGVKGRQLITSLVTSVDEFATKYGRTGA